MSGLTSYIFKPKYGLEVSKKIIEAFCSDYLGFATEGLYLWWRPETGGRLCTPEGYVELHIDSENGFQHFTETCYHGEELTASQLADDLYILLGDEFWYDDIESGGKLYNLEDRELSEIVEALCATDSRMVSFGSGREVYTVDINSEGKNHRKHVDMLEYALALPIVKESQQQVEQLQLSLL